MGAIHVDDLKEALATDAEVARPSDNPLDVGIGQLAELLVRYLAGAVERRQRSCDAVECFALGIAVDGVSARQQHIVVK